MKATACILAFGAAIFLAAPAGGDWDETDPHKMHWPQMPDPFGWDVDVTWGWTLADDWECSQSGFVDDVHFWYSWLDDVPSPITQIHVSIHSNIPADPNDPGSFSMPGSLLWARDFFQGEFTTRLWADDGDQDFMMAGGDWIDDNHKNIYQCNITDIFDPFFQFENQIYWLDLSIMYADPSAHIGWKTCLSEDYFMDDAVYWDGNGWAEILDPLTSESLHMSFVITPEPTTLAFLAIGAVILLRRR
jgi:hypothetical protein